MVSKQILTLLFLCLLLLSQFSWAGLFSRVNKTSMSNIEELELTVSAKNLTTNALELNLEALKKDFLIVGQSKSRSLQIVNGNRSSSIDWSILLEPKRVGKLQIPSFKIGNDVSKAIDIEVKNAANIDLSKQAIFLMAKVNNQQPSIQEQVIYTISLYSTQHANINLRIPVSVNNALVKSLGDSGALKQTTYQGKTIWLKQYYYGIYPQELGNITIPRIKQNVQLLSQNKRSNLVLFSPAITLMVKDPDLNYPANKHWLPANDVKLSAQFITNPPIFKVGEVVVREIILSVSGQGQTQLPELPLPNDKAFEQYNDDTQFKEAVKQKSIQSQLIQKVIIIPNEPGKQILPEIQIPWFDIIAQKNKIAILPAQEINVLDASINNYQIKNQPIAPKISKSITAELPKEVVKSDLENKPQTKDYTIARTFLVLWLLTLLWCYYRCQTKPKKEKDDTQQQRKSALETNKKLLKNIKVSSANNEAKASKKALNIWLLANYPRYLNLNDFAKSTQNTDFINALNALDKSLHQQDNAQNNWQGNELWQAFSKVIHQKKNHQKETMVPELYPSKLKDSPI